MTFDQFVRLLDILKWPLVVLLLGLIAIFMFRSQFAAFLSRLTSIGKEGLKAAPAVANQQNQPDRNKEVQDLMRALDSAVVVAQERLIKADLEKRGLDHAGETINVLVRYLANCQLTVASEEVYRLIFGSQIYILKRANESRVKSKLKRSVVEEHFRHTQTLFPAVFTDWDTDRYMSFLLARRVLLYANDEYTITPFGAEFLAWMGRVGAIENKPL